ncbi:MAG: hypothetical protein R6X20_13770 [Phycisphaerae bacterium]
MGNAKRELKTKGERWIVRTLGDVARFFRLTYDTIKTWRRQGMPGTAGKFDLAEVVAWRDGRQKDPAQPTSPHAALARVKAEREQFELQREQAAWVEVDPICRLIERTVNECRTVLDQLPDQLVAQLPQDLPAEALADCRARCARAIDGVYATLAEINTAEEVTGEPAEE